MRNLDLAHDYLKRARVRVGALEVLYEGESWADVVRESQEVVELALKALLRASGVDVPRVHDVAPILHAERARLPGSLAPFVDELADASRQLRRDRELAFYGAEDLTPGEFYTQADADRALASARRVVELVSQHLPGTF
ncbi:MAG: HEPN domain-containing protein [Trueperaceae bacterium]